MTSRAEGGPLLAYDSLLDAEIAAEERAWQAKTEEEEKRNATQS